MLLTISPYLATHFFGNHVLPMQLLQGSLEKHKVIHKSFSPLSQSACFGTVVLRESIDFNINFTFIFVRVWGVQETFVPR